MGSGLWGRLFGTRKARHLESGEWGEVQAEKYLAGKGWKILGRRVRNGNREELDLVARAGGILVFIEVKTRASERFGRPIESVNRRKKALLCRAAARYLTKLKNPRVYYRFDVVEVIGSPDAGMADLRHTENAFLMDKRYTI